MRATRQQSLMPLTNAQGMAARSTSATQALSRSRTGSSTSTSTPLPARKPGELPVSSQAGGATVFSLRLPAGLPPGVTQQALHDFIAASSDAQWFTGKGRTVSSVNIAERAPIDVAGGDGRYEVALLEVRYQDGGSDVFHAPLRITNGTVADALADPAFVRAMVAAMRDGRSLRSSSGALQARPIPGAALPSDVASLLVKPLGVPQSNVSIRVGDDVIFKAYRKPEPGITIEREVTEHLTRQRYQNTPQLLGTLTLDTKSGPVTVGMAFERIHSDGDGWTSTLAALAGVDAGGQQLKDSLALLGTRIGEMHRALGAVGADAAHGAPVDPAFAPRPIAKSDLQAWQASITRELDDTIALAAAADPALGAKLLAARPMLVARLAQLDDVEPSGMKTRIHGDLHLGQVLRRDGDWVVLDFEGEPARTKEERRGFYTPLRDVAGMLRSFAYAEAEAKAPAGWAKEAGKGFVAAYKKAAADTGLMPTSDDAFDAILAAVELEKALYEVRYELKSRPALVHIPAARVLEIANERAPLSRGPHL